MTAASLSADQRAHYAENGYLLLPGFFAAEELEPWLERFADIASGDASPPRGMLVMQDVMVAKGVRTTRERVEGIAKIQDLQNDPVLFDGYVRHERLLDLVEAFVGPDIKSIHSMLINKPPHVDGRHPLHQDLLYFPFRPAEEIVGTWTALERVTKENGCLVVVPGSQRGELLRHENPDWEHLNFGYFGAAGVGAHADRVHLEMEPGDLLLFHPLLLHGSGRNRSSGFRRAISAHYASARCRFLPGAEPVAEVRPYILVRGERQEGAI